MNKIIECVPNFSEGKDLKIITAIENEIKSVKDVKLLSSEPNADYNRTVITMVGSPEGIEEAAFKAIKKAGELIDMKVQKGEHPRLGATDVCPFIPVSGVSMQECVALAKRLGKRVAEELNIPIYLYEEAATTEERRNLSNIRKGEYEGLSEKIKDPNWKPDFGKTEFNAKSGATVMGARSFLVAYNVNIKATDVKPSDEIAKTIRESGKKVNGVKVPGTLKAVKGMGVELKEYNITQVSMNLVNYHITSVHTAFEEVIRLAKEYNVEVNGSEIVGLVPKEPLIWAAEFAAKKNSETLPSDEFKKIEYAVKYLGLNAVMKFDINEKVLEYKMQNA